MTASVATSRGRSSPQVAHALEIRSEVLQIICGDKAKHRGESDQLEIGAGGGTDRVTGGETLEVGGRLSEHVAHSAQLRAVRVDSHVKGRLDLSLHSDMTLLGGAMSETWAGAVLTLSGMSDNMVGGIGTRVSVLDLWMSGLTGMEEKIATVAADLAFVELYVNHMEREYVAGSHLAGVAVFSGAVFTTMATGFRQLVKVASGVRDLGSGGDGGGGGGGPDGGSGSPPPVPAGGNPGMLNDVDESSSAEDVRRAADTPPVEKPKRRVQFAEDDVVILFEDPAVVDDLADVEEVRQGDEVGAGEDVRRVGEVGGGEEGRQGEEVEEVVDVRRLEDPDEPDGPPEVPERTQAYYDQVMQDERKKNRIALALEIQALEKQFEGQELSEWERLQALQTILLDLQKQTDPDDHVRVEELKRLLENNKVQQADLVRRGKDTRAKRLETVYAFADEVGDQPPPLPARDPDLGGPPLPPRDPDLGGAPVPLPRVEAPRPVVERLTPEDYRKLYGIPDDFDFDNEWKKLQELTQKVEKKNLGGIAGDPNNGYVAMTLGDAQKQIQELAKAYYDEALPPELRALTVGHDLGENPTPDQVRKLLVDLIDEQKRIGETWVSDLSSSDLEDIQKLEDLLNSFDANTHHILQDAHETADAFSKMEWKRLPENADIEKLVDEIDKLVEQTTQQLEDYMQDPTLEVFGEHGADPEYSRLNSMIEELKKVKRNVAAGYDPTTGLDMNLKHMNRVLNEGGTGMAPEVFEALSVSMKQTIQVNEDLKKTWATLLDSVPPTDLDVEDMLWRFEKEAWFQRNTGDQGGSYWKWGTNTEGATIITQEHGELRIWAEDFAKQYGVEIKKYDDYGDQSEKVRQWYTDKYSKVADRGLTLDQFTSPSGVRQPPQGELRNVRRSFLDAIAAAETDDVARAEELRKALAEFDQKMYSSITSSTRQAEAVFNKPIIPLDPGFDKEALFAKFEELQINIQLVESPEAADALTEAQAAGRDTGPAGDRLVALTWKASAFNRAKQAVEEGRDPLAEILDMMNRPRYHIAKNDRLAKDSTAQLQGLQEAYDILARMLRDPQYRKPQAIIGDDVARVLRRLPERYERVIVPRGAETPDDVRRALAPLRGDLTEVKDWEVLWYHRQLVDNTRQADELKRRFPSAFTETLALEYHELSQLYEDEWMRRFNTVEQVEEVFREGQRSGVHPLDAYVDPYVERFLGRGGQTVQPDPELVEKLTKFSEAFQPYVGRDADLVAKLGEYKGALWEMKRQESFHGAWQGTVYHGVDSTMGVWKQYTLSKGLGNRPGGYDILGDIDVVLEGIRVQLQKGVDPNAVFDSYLAAGRRLYFDDDMLGVSDAVVEVLRDAVNKLLADSGVGVVGRGAPVVGSGSGGRLFESLGPHILYYVQKAILMADRGVTLGTGLQLLEDGEPGGEKRRGAGWRAGGSGSVDGLPELLGEGRWVSVFEGDRVRWQWGGGGGGEERYTGSGGEGEGEAEADEEPEAEAWLGEEAEGAEARQAVRAGVPWRTAPGGGAAGVGAGEPTDIAGAAFAGVVYYTATTPSVGSWARRLVAPGGPGEGEGEESYETRRAWLEKVIGAGPEYARPPLPVLAGFAGGAEKLLVEESQAEESQAEASQVEASRAPGPVSTGGGEEELDVLEGASTRALAERDAARLRQLVLDAREEGERGIKVRNGSDAGVGMVPEWGRGVGQAKGFRGRPRFFPWGQPWSGG